MSDLEEPPAKLRRYEMSSQFLEGEVEEDGQEEWLSEGILTDDDYNANAEQDQSASNIDTSQDGTMTSMDNSIEHLNDSQEGVDGLNVSADGQNISTDVSTTGETVSIHVHTVSKTQQNVSTPMQSVSTHVQSVSTPVQSVSTNVQSVSRIGQAVRKDLNAGLNVQNITFGIAVQGRHFVVDGTKLKAEGNVVQAQDFEESLKVMEESQHNEPEFPEDLNAFLIRKKDGKLITGNPKLVPIEDKHSDIEDKHSDIEDSPKHSDAEDDGNDTDGLLRLLGDGDGKNKKVNDDDDETADEEDFNFEGAKIKTVTLANNAVIRRYPTRKAVQEDDDMTDASSDDEPVKKVIKVQQKVNRPAKVDTSAATLQKPFIQPRHTNTSTPVRKYGSKRVGGTKVLAKPGKTVNPFLGAPGTSILGVTLRSPVTTTVKTPGKTVVKTPVTSAVKTPVTSAVKTPVTSAIKTPVTSVVKTPVTSAVKTPVTSAVKTPVTSAVKTPVTSAVKTPVTSAIKTPVTSAVKTPVTAAVKTPVTAAVKSPVTTAVKTPVTTTVKTPVTTVKTPVSATKVSSGVKVAQAMKGPFSGIGTSKYNSKNTLQQQKATSVSSIKKTNPRKTEDEEDSDDDEDDDDDDVPLKSSERSEGQAAMKQEDMDEDMTSDVESETDEESLYDELPSSEDDSFNEWFTIDIRAERAGDYIPLMGEKAEQLLLEEKNRVSIRLDNLRKSLSALTETSKEQADKLRIATAELAKLDTQIKAA